MSPNPLQTLAPLNFLVVDDDPLVAGITSDHYTDLGFAVDCASNGTEALQKMEARLPDLVLCDRRMPGMCGADLLEEVRARPPEWQAVAFVFVTALTDRRDRYAMMPLHPDGYITKPIDFASADELLARILRAKRHAGPPPT